MYSGNLPLNSIKSFLTTMFNIVIGMFDALELAGLVIFGVVELSIFSSILVSSLNERHIEWRSFITSRLIDILIGWFWLRRINRKYIQPYRKISGALGENNRPKVRGLSFKHKNDKSSKHFKEDTFKFRRYVIPILPGTDQVDEAQFMEDILPDIRSGVISINDLIDDLGVLNCDTKFYRYICHGCDYKPPASLTAFKRRIIHYRRTKAVSAEIYDSQIFAIKQAGRNVHHKNQYVKLLKSIKDDYLYSMVPVTEVSAEIVNAGRKFGCVMPEPHHREDVQEYVFRIFPIVLAKA